ncbi:hypothetical protein [Sutterella megalosphaeroides]|uniref:Uncharacterized protein n=1 Tax=Sutterella megalosphaeroides TaxID=2494234 RepID=A0A2Z6IAI0_9BURK|nr:hypothetical protein [Sutterella megalosphaeroides]BBF23429.1 hypothetical protein SUTMEG_13200 [Sutterella megalosphaeroides]
MRTFALLLCLAPLCAQAYVAGGSNLPGYYYPEFSEFPPSKPYGNNRYEAERYRNEVEEYVRKAEEYMENAEYDARRAIEAAEEARDKANRAVEEYNNWVQNGY